MVPHLPWLAKRILDHVVDGTLLHFCKKVAARAFDRLMGKLLAALVPFEVFEAVVVVFYVICAIAVVGAIGLTAYGLKKSLSA